MERAGRWQNHTLYNFGSKANDADGLGFGAALLRRGASEFYGASAYPYELWFGADGRWHERVLYRFNCNYKSGDGCGPVGTLVSDAQGNLYGVTEWWGIQPCPSGGDGCGTVYELSPQPDGKWKEEVLHRFASFPNDGELPFAGVVMDKAGNLYGTTAQGGSVHNRGVCLVGCGNVYKLSRTPQGNWKETILYNFCQAKNCSDGLGAGALTMDAAGNLYGTTSERGKSGLLRGLRRRVQDDKGQRRKMEL